MKNEKIICENVTNTNEPRYHLVSKCWRKILPVQVSWKTVLILNNLCALWLHNFNPSYHNSITFTEQAIYNHFFMVHFYLCVWEFTTHEELVITIRIWPDSLKRRITAFVKIPSLYTILFGRWIISFQFLNSVITCLFFFFLHRLLLQS